MYMEALFIYLLEARSGYVGCLGFIRSHWFEYLIYPYTYEVIGYRRCSIPSLTRMCRATPYSIAHGKHMGFN